MIYGYARCSTNDSKQDIRRQIRELKAAGAEEVVFEYEHGDARIKKELQMLLDTARAGDSIFTLEVSRLSRSTQQLCEIINIIRQKRLRLVIVGSITVDCRSGEIDPMSQAFIQMSPRPRAHPPCRAPAGRPARPSRGRAGAPLRRPPRRRCPWL